jgi:hypothetical protein
VFVAKFEKIFLMGDEHFTKSGKKKEDKIIAPNLLLDDICDKMLWTN